MTQPQLSTDHVYHMWAFASRIFFNQEIIKENRAFSVSRIVSILLFYKFSWTLTFLGYNIITWSSASFPFSEAHRKLLRRRALRQGGEHCQLRNRKPVCSSCWNILANFKELISGFFLCLAKRINYWKCQIHWFTIFDVPLFVYLKGCHCLRLLFHGRAGA